LSVVLLWDQTSDSDHTRSVLKQLGSPSMREKAEVVTVLSRSYTDVVRSKPSRTPLWCLDVAIRGVPPHTHRRPRQSRH
jgi:hypothetical protein